MLGRWNEKWLPRFLLYGFHNVHLRCRLLPAAFPIPLIHSQHPFFIWWERAGIMASGPSISKINVKKWKRHLFPFNQLPFCLLCKSGVSFIKVGFLALIWTCSRGCWTAVCVYCYTVTTFCEAEYIFKAFSKFSGCFFSLSLSLSYVKYMCGHGC